MTLDQKVRERIVQEFGVSLCVEASAGTGKTTLMVDRVVNQVLSGLPLSQIVAITFTEKGAGELKQRIRQALEKKRSEMPSCFDMLTQALSELDNAQISTIHGFTASMLRERPVEARIDPNFTQLDELGSGLLVDQVWEQWLDRILASNNDTMKLALVLGLELEQMRVLFGELYQRREHADLLPQASFSVAQAAAETRRIVREVIPYMQFCRNPETDSGFKQWTKVLESFNGAALDNSLGLIKFLRELKLNRNAGNKNYWRPDYGDKQKRKTFELYAVRSRFFGSILADLLLLLKSGIAHVEQEKSKRNVLDFDDLLLKTRDLLQRDKATRQYFQGQFRSIIVDEFQDTDPLQVEIVFFLCEQGAKASHWTEVKLQPGKLCIVGDPKQSIYRFRRADIETYMAAQESIAKQGEVLPIRENFRSAKSLVDWVNSAFSTLIVREENYQPAYQELVTSEPLEGTIPRVTALYNAVSPASAHESRQMEAGALVSVLRRIRDENWEIKKKGGGFRKPEWRDIAILFRSLTTSHLYEGALRAADIPYRLDGGKQFFTRQEIHALAACLKAIDDPADQIALVAALRSLFFGFSDEELFRLRQATGSLSYFKTSQSERHDEVALGAFEIDPEMAHALMLLRSLHEERNRVSFAYTLEHLYRETHALEKHLLIRFGQQAVANLQKAVVRARAFEQVGPTTFRRFVKWLHQLEERGQQEPESTLVETDDDAVELLSIHKAKGLEFPIVILANLSAQAGDGFAAVLSRGAGSLEFHIRTDDELNLNTEGFEIAKEAERRRLDAEDIRLLYVGATRARDYLLISNFDYGKTPHGLLEHLRRVLPPVSKIPEDQIETVSHGVRLWKVPPAALPHDPETSTRVEIGPESASPWEENLQRWHKLRAESFQRAQISWSPQTASAAKLPPIAEASFASARVTAMIEASALGSAFHRVLYRIAREDLDQLVNLDREPAGDARSEGAAHQSNISKYLKPLIEQTALEYGLPHWEELFKLIYRPFPPSLAEEFRTARQLHREVPFLLDLGEEFALAGKKFPAIYEGVIDVLLEKPDGTLLIVDYKTDQVAASQVPERRKLYQQQARIYRAAVQRVTSNRVSDVWFYFVRPGVISSE
ncbi:MAG TPA: UvrD-helicase domain-containing protein [Acidobacteriota bacterium]|jgi:ATP-dependent helicase/nuclease subunit A